MRMTEKIKDTVRLSMGTILVFLSILSTTVMGFQYVKSLAEQNRKDIGEHKTSDEKKWDAIYAEVKNNHSDIVELKLDIKETTVHYAEILRRLDGIDSKMDNLEIIGD